LHGHRIEYPVTNALHIG